LTQLDRSKNTESMNPEPTGLEMRARRHAALGEPARLAIIERLLLSDASPGELGHQFDLPSNLIAHHLALLEQAGLITRTRSQSDHRRTYVALAAGALAELEPTTSRSAARVVFVCTANSARSPLAEALWRQRSRVPTTSAGTEPAARLHPATIDAATRHGLRLASKHTRHIEHAIRPGDLVVAVCDRAHENASIVRTDPWLHWSIPDPESAATEAAFDTTVAELTDRIDRLATAIHRRHIDPRPDGRETQPSSEEN
jgi:protein-tyrosine-phosphatase/DNA-binding transcriptional ArsR family regulator